MITDEDLKDNVEQLEINYEDLKSIQRLCTKKMSKYIENNDDICNELLEDIKELNYKHIDGSDIDNDNIIDLVDMFGYDIWNPNGDLKIASINPDIHFEIKYNNNYIINIINNKLNINIPFDCGRNKLDSYNGIFFDKLKKVLKDNFSLSKDDSQEIIKDFTTKLFDDSNSGRIKSLKYNKDKPKKEETIKKLNDDDDSLYILSKYKIVNDRNVNFGIHEALVGKGKTKNYVCICNVPCHVSGRGINIDNNNDMFILSYNDYWKGNLKMPVYSDELLTKKGISGLLNKGILIEETYFKNMTKYFNDFININRNKLDQHFLTEYNGWKKNRSMFAFGESGFTKDKIIPLQPVDSKISRSLQQKGKIEDFKNDIKDVIKIPMVRFKIYAAATAFILRLLGMNNIIIDHHGKSSSGKTITCQIALKMIGNPTNNGLTQSDTTIFAAEKTLLRYNDMPVLFDEFTKMPKHVSSKIVYTVGNGITKSRGRKDQTFDEGHAFHTVIFVTTEGTIVDQDSFEGEQARVIQISNVLDYDEELGKKFEQIKLGLDDNYGFLTEPFLQKIFNNKSKLKKMYGQSLERIQESCDNNFDRRKALSFAGIEVAGRLIEEVMDEMGLDVMLTKEIIDEFFNHNKEEHAVESPSMVYLKHLMDWKEKKQNYINFVSDDPNDCTYSDHDILGYENNLAFEISKDVLENDALGEYNQGNMKSVYKEWREAGIIKANKDRYTIVGINGKRVIRFIKSKVDSALGCKTVNSMEVTENKPLKLNIGNVKAEIDSNKCPEMLFKNDD